MKFDSDANNGEKNMGWKNVKEHYRIEHIVQVTDQGICIGSGYIHDIIVIGLDGALRKRYDERSNDDLRRYQQEIDADPTTLRRLIEAPDTFSSAVLVYNYDGGDILERRCEALGWPNVTHDGELMFDNLFSADKATVVAWAKRNADLGIHYGEESVEEAKQRLSDCFARLDREKANRAKLEAEHPTATPNPQIDTVPKKPDYP